LNGLHTVITEMLTASSKRQEKGINRRKGKTFDHQADLT